ncbi:MAG: hypothetical protein ACTSRY_02250 [Alphaproteobacteria bacterium]
MAFTDIDTADLAQRLLSGAATEAGEGWAEVSAFFKVEFRGIARRTKDIGKAVAGGDIDEMTAKLLMRMQVNNAVAAVAAMTTLVMLRIERIINAALSLIRDLVNAALGFALV